MHDGLELETRGVPTVVICTQPFVPTAAEISATRGVPDYRFAVVEHPIGNLTDAELQQRVDAALAAVNEILGSRGLLPADESCEPR